MAPNIFKYATKELSQDAVICWLVACAREAEGDLRECGRSFVRALMQSGEGQVINALTGEREKYLGAGQVTDVVLGPCPQHRGIDVYFQAKVDGKEVSFVVEDKTHTEHHSGQLERYRGLVEKDQIPEQFIKAVYFKTGYVFDDEREQVERAGYSVFEAKDAVAFLGDGQWSKTHAFVRDYAEHVNELVNCRQLRLDSWDLDWDFVQWKFMVALGKALDGTKAKSPARWVNRGGGAWTQYPHYESDGRVLYWRLDSEKPLRLMVDTKQAKQAGGERALDDWDTWDQEFRDATDCCDLEPVSFRRVRSRNGSPVAEGTIGAVNVRSCLESEGLDECVKKVCELHRQFIEKSGLTLG